LQNLKGICGAQLLRFRKCQIASKGRLQLELECYVFPEPFAPLATSGLSAIEVEMNPHAALCAKLNPGGRSVLS
jgi:hypothetical protein